MHLLYIKCFSRYFKPKSNPDAVLPQVFLFQIEMLGVIGPALFSRFKFPDFSLQILFFQTEMSRVLVLFSRVKFSELFFLFSLFNYKCPKSVVWCFLGTNLPYGFTFLVLNFQNSQSDFVLQVQILRALPPVLLS